MSVNHVKTACAASVLAAAWGCERPAVAQSEERASARTRQAREEMVEDQLIARGVQDPRVLAAMRRVPRHEFVPPAEQPEAYDDGPLPIGYQQTISQPYIVALMTELLELDADDRVLEVGTGSGYQAAILGELAHEVFSIEIVAPLAERAKATLARLGYGNVVVRHGDGYAGWPEHAPFDGIIVTAAPPTIPEPLKRQLAVGGRLVVPVGRGNQMLRVFTRTPQGVEEHSILPVMFVPMTGQAQHPPD